MLPEGYATLKMEAQNDIAIVVDASESAEPHRDAIMKTVSLLLDKLPADCAGKLYFLSNARQYDATRLTRNAARWWKDNNQRGSFITPVLHALSACQVVVVGSGRIYDLEDWKGSGRESSLLFVFEKESLRNGLDIGREFDCSQLPEVIASLHNPVLSVEIRGDGFMPYSWDNSEYRLTLEGPVALAATNPKNLPVSIRFFGSNITARIVRKSGEEELSLDGTASPAEPEQWSALPEAEACTFVNAVKGERISCPVCHEPHPPSTLRCDRTTILGEPVYPSLAHHRGFVCFRNVPQGVHFKTHPVSVLKLGAEKVAVAYGNKATIFEYAGKKQGWKSTGIMPLYHQVDNVHVILL